MLAVTVTAGLCAALLRFIPLQEMGMRFRFGVPHMAGHDGRRPADVPA